MWKASANPSARGQMQIATLWSFAKSSEFTIDKFSVSQPQFEKVESFRPVKVGRFRMGAKRYCESSFDGVSFKQNAYILHGLEPPDLLSKGSTRYMIRGRQQALRAKPHVYRARSRRVSLTLSSSQVLLTRTNSNPYPTLFSLYPISRCSRLSSWPWPS